MLARSLERNVWPGRSVAALAAAAAAEAEAEAAAQVQCNQQSRAEYELTIVPTPSLAHLLNMHVISQTHTHRAKGMAGKGRGYVNRT